MCPVVVRMHVQSASRDGLESVDPHAIRIGLAIPLQGPGGIFGPSCEAVSELFRRQVNEAGLLGRPVELEVIDAGQPPEKVARDRKSTRLNSSHVATSYAGVGLHKQPPSQ